MKKFSLRKGWANWMLEQLEQQEQQNLESYQATLQEKRENIDEIEEKLQRLLDTYLEQTIEEQNYLEKQRELKSKKKTLEEEIENLEQDHLGWLEPMREWVEISSNIGKVAQSDDKFAKKDLLSQIARSNLVLKNKKARLRRAQPCFATLRAANKKLGGLENPSEKDKNHIKVGREGFEPP